MTKAQSVKRGIHSLALLSALVLAGCSSTDPNLNLPSPAKTAGSPEQEIKQAYKTSAQNGPEVLISAADNNGSYNNMRRALARSSLPGKDSIQLSEWVNFFPYDYPQPQGRIPFAANGEIAVTPWNPNTRLLRVAIKAGDTQASAERRAANLVVLVGGEGADLSLIKTSLTHLVNQLTPQDTLTLLSASGDKGVLLEPTTGDKKDKMLSAISSLSSGKTLQDSSRLTEAYTLAKDHYIADGINRVILVGNSTYNAGFSTVQDASDFFANHPAAQISLTTLGFTASQFSPSPLAEVAYVGHGVHQYIDNVRDSDKVWDEQLSATQTPVAKEFSMKVEFNPTYIKAYRLLGYQAPSEESSNAANSGVVVTGQTMTALYEIIPAGSSEEWSAEQYGFIGTPSANSYLRQTKEIAMMHLRYKTPNAQGTPQRIELPVPESQMNNTLDNSSKDFRFAAAVAAFAQQLKDNGTSTGTFTLDDTLKLANEGRGADKYDLRSEFIQLVGNAQNELPKSSPVKGQGK